MTVAPKKGRFVKRLGSKFTDVASDTEDTTRSRTNRAVKQLSRLGRTDLRAPASCFVMAGFAEGAEGGLGGSRD